MIGFWLPADPIVEVVRSGKLYARLSRAQQRAYDRARSSGRITDLQADRICEAIGRHPFELYGPSWFEDPA